jgi:hypothetical protein
MASNLTKWSAYGTYTELIATASLKNIATTAAVLGSEVDNTAGYQYADLTLLIDLATAATAGGYVSLWFVRAVDGTNYETWDASNIPPRPADVVIPVRSNAADSQATFVGPVLWPQGKFKCLFQNNTGQTTTNTDNLNKLYFRAYSDDLITA